MKRWEYRVEHTSFSDPDLNALGQDGWELCAVAATLSGTIALHWHYYFKRELPSDAR